MRNPRFAICWLTCPILRRRCACRAYANDCDLDSRKRKHKKQISSDAELQRWHSSERSASLRPECIVLGTMCSSAWHRRHVRLCTNSTLSRVSTPSTQALDICDAFGVYNKSVRIKIHIIKHMAKPPAQLVGLLSGLFGLKSFYNETDRPRHGTA